MTAPSPFFHIVETSRWLKVDNRTLFVIAPDGKISYVAAPFREIDPTSYPALAAEINKVAGDTTQGR